MTVLSDLLTALKANARWCLASYAGILTPTGRPKVPPRFLIVKCRSCDELSLNTSKLPKEKRDKCQRHLLRKKSKAHSYWGPMTVVCGGKVDIVEEVSL